MSLSVKQTLGSDAADCKSKLSSQGDYEIAGSILAELCAIARPNRITIIADSQPSKQAQSSRKASAFSRLAPLSANAMATGSMVLVAPRFRAFCFFHPPSTAPRF